MDRKHIRRIFVVIVAVAMFVFIYPVDSFAVFFTLYILYGPVRSVIALYKRSKLLKP